MKKNRPIRTFILTWISLLLCLLTVGLTTENLYFANYLPQSFISMTPIFYSAAVHLAVLLFPLIGLCAVADVPAEVRARAPGHGSRRFLWIALVYLILYLTLANPLTAGFFGLIDTDGFYAEIFSILIPALTVGAFFIITGIHLILVSLLMILLFRNEEPHSLGWGAVSCVLLDITFVVALFFTVLLKGG